MKMLVSSMIFLSLLIIGLNYIIADMITSNFYPALYPIIDDYFWANTIMFVVSYLVLNGLAFLLFSRALRDKGK